MASTAGDDQPSAVNAGDGQPQVDERTPLINQPGDADTAGDDAELDHFSERMKKWRRERWISGAISLFLMTAVIVLIVLFAVFRSGLKTSGPSNALCLTPACIHAADQFLQNLSPNYRTLDPCSEFEEFVCGGWRSHHQMRSDQGSVSSMGVLAEENQNVLRNILEGVYPGSSDHSVFSPMNLGTTAVSVDEENFDSLQRAFNACMAKPEIARVGIAPIENLLKRISQIFPVEESSSGVGEVLGHKEISGLADAILYLERMGVDSFVSLGAGSDDKNPDTVVVFASPRYGVGLPTKGYYDDKDLLAKYEKVIKEVIGSIHPSKRARRQAGTLAKNVVDLEVQLAAASPELKDLANVTKSYNPMSLEETAKLVTQFGLDKILNSLVPSGYEVDRMITSFPEYFTNLSDTLAVTSIDTVQTFLLWKVVQATASDVESTEIKPYTRFMNQLMGKDPDAVSERYKTCILHVDDGLGWILSRFFVEAAFSAKAKDLGNQVIYDIKDQFIKKVQTLEWMDNEVKKVAINKVNNLRQKIGYPEKSPDVMNPEALSAYYAGLHITNDYFNNALAMSELAVNKSWDQLGKPTDKNQWEMTASTVNAYYNPPGNEIVFPAGIMQFPFFSAELPSYVNYGAFGAVSGHELSHAFDVNGRLYDVDGRLTDWWTEQTVERFEKRADCFVQEYDNFTVVGSAGTMHVDGRQTEGENIADAGGLAAAFSAWLARRQDYPDEDLPGLDFFTQEQLFYIVYGNVWCSKATPASLTHSILGDPHAPASLRTRGAAMMNSRGFREAFSCPVKEPTCELW